MKRLGSFRGQPAVALSASLLALMLFTMPASSSESHAEAAAVWPRAMWPT